jgi:hypothetical protein
MPVSRNYWIGPEGGLGFVGKRTFQPYRESNPDHPDRNTTTILTELHLSRLYALINSLSMKVSATYSKESMRHAVFPVFCGLLFQNTSI